MDRRRRVKVMIDRHYPEWSANKIAQHCGVSHNTVLKHADGISQRCQTDNVTDSLGRQQPATKPRTPKDNIDTQLQRHADEWHGLDDAEYSEKLKSLAANGGRLRSKTETEVIDGNTGEVIENPGATAAPHI